MHCKLASVPLCLWLAACGGAALEPASAPTQARHRAALTCGQTPAPALFAHSVCLCGDLDAVGALELRAGADAPSLAVNGKVSSVSSTEVQGDLLAYGGVDATAELTVGGDLLCGADIDYVGGLTVAGHLEAQGGLQGVGALEVGGDLAVAGPVGTLGTRTVHGTSRAPAPMAAPCGCGAARLDVVAVVAEARTANDNRVRGVAQDALRAVGASTLTLTTGRYYFDGAASVGGRRVRVEGAVSLYVDGDLTTVGAEQFSLAEGASLDLYVAGGVETVGALSLGAEADPSAFRLYIGGTEPVMVTVGAGEVFGAIYAPRATLSWVGEMQVAGAVFAKDLDGVGKVAVTYYRPTAVEVPPEACPEPDPGTSIPDGEIPNL